MHRAKSQYLGRDCASSVVNWRRMKTPDIMFGLEREQQPHVTKILAPIRAKFNVQEAASFMDLSLQHDSNRSRLSWILAMHGSTKCLSET